VLCTPPSDCKSFEMGASCCEFICLDDEIPSLNSANNNGFATYFDFNSNHNRLLILASALTPTFVIMCCLVRCCYQKHRESIREIETEEPSSMERDGQVHYNAFMKICDKTGKNVKSGEIGEIYMKFEFGFLRSYNELPEAMRNTMDREGFYRTGDIGYLKRGVVYILDKNRYISDQRNSNVSFNYFSSHFASHCSSHIFRCDARGFKATLTNNIHATTFLNNQNHM
jgi:hypothetical protein